MCGHGRVLLAMALLCGLSGCFAISLPKKIVVNEPGQAKPAPERPAAQRPDPCDLSDLPSIAPGERPTLAVLDFQYGESLDAEVGRALADLCRNAIQESGRFVLVDRERIADVLGERDFAEATQCDSAVCLVKYGKLLGAQKMMHGRINRLGEVYVLSTGMTDVETSEQISKSASLESIEDSTEAIPDLVCQILQNAPTDGR